MANLLVPRDVIIACGGTQDSFTALPSAHRWHANNYCERRTRHNTTPFHHICFIASSLCTLCFTICIIFSFLQFYPHFCAIIHISQSPVSHTNTNIHVITIYFTCVFYYFSFSCTDKLNINPFVFSILLFAVILIIIFSIYTYYISFHQLYVR